MDFIPISNQLSDFQRAFLLRFYRSQFWRLQKPERTSIHLEACFIGHNFGDYKNLAVLSQVLPNVLSVTILETTKTSSNCVTAIFKFYRSQFWRLQKPRPTITNFRVRFIGHNFGDYKNWLDDEDKR